MSYRVFIPPVEVVADLMSEAIIPAPAAGSSSVPIFLKKTYTMFENAPSWIASWANNGTTIVIKDPKEFADIVLPKYFKHNNFASYVRQLNFYGFRKYKKDDIFLVDEDDSTKNWSEFYHEQFLRDQPELMVHIRRKTYSEGETTDKEDVEELKRQVVSFQNQLETLTGQITNLTAVVSSLIARGGKRLTGNSQNDAEQGNKRPRRNISEEECATFL
jgi:hypothetical protein